MKYVCMNYQDCDFVEYLDFEDLKDAPKFKACSSCNCLTVLIKNNSNIQDILESQLYLIFEDEQRNVNSTKSKTY